MLATLQLYSSMHFISNSSLWFYCSHLLFGWPLPISAWCLWKWQLHLSMEACQILKRLCPVDLLSTTKIWLRFLIFSLSWRDSPLLVHVRTDMCVQLYICKVSLAWADLKNRKKVLFVMQFYSLEVFSVDTVKLFCFLTIMHAFHFVYCSYKPHRNLI